MSGHSKWATTKRKKAVIDAKRGKMFTKLIKEITISAREGGGDPAGNPRLRLAIDNAKSANMPQDNIDRAIKKGTGDSGGAAEFFDQVYEGFGPNGEAFYIKVLTDNKNRTAAELRNIFSKHGGSLGGPGSTAYIFTPDPEKPSYLVEINTENQMRSLKSILEDLDDNEDVQDMYFNFELDEDEE